MNSDIDISAVSYSQGELHASRVVFEDERAEGERRRASGTEGELEIRRACGREGGDLSFCANIFIIAEIPHCHNATSLSLSFFCLHYTYHTKKKSIHTNHCSYLLK